MEAPECGIVPVELGEVQLVGVDEDEVGLLHTFEYHRRIPCEDVQAIVVGLQPGPQGHIVGLRSEGVWKSVALPGLFRCGVRGGDGRHSAGCDGGQMCLLIFCLLLSVNHRQGYDGGHGGDGQDHTGHCHHFAEVDAFLHVSAREEEDRRGKVMAIYVLP